MLDHSHWACGFQLRKYGGKPECCACTNHECGKPDYVSPVSDKPMEKQLLERIAALTGTSFCEEMAIKHFECSRERGKKALINKFSRDESMAMAEIIGDVYRYAHRYSGCCKEQKI